MMRTITPIFSIILAILLYFFFISPIYAEIKEIRMETESFLMAAEDYDNFNKDSNKLLGLKSSQSPLTIERLNQLVPENIDSAHLIADLEAMAKKQNMLFGSISTETTGATLGGSSSDSLDLNTQTPANEELQTTDISFELIGTYDQFQAFLTELESSLTLMEVTSIEFTASNGLFEQFGVTVRAYALPAEIN